MAEPSAEPKPNVVVAHLAHGIEVVHLYSGRTLCQVPVRVGSDAAHSCIPFMLISVRDRVCAAEVTVTAHRSRWRPARTRTSMATARSTARWRAWAMRQRRTTKVHAPAARATTRLAAHSTGMHVAA